MTGLCGNISKLQRNPTGKQSKEIQFNVFFILIRIIQVLSVWKRYSNGLEQCFVAFKTSPSSRTLQHSQAAGQEKIKKYFGVGETWRRPGDSGED